jgi:hypothetical protein
MRAIHSTARVSLPGGFTVSTRMYSDSQVVACSVHAFQSIDGSLMSCSLLE